jgi:hypothetical protein
MKPTPIGWGLEPAPRKGNFMNTYSGTRYWPIDPRPEDIRIEDVAHHLSLLCRYTGAVRRFYSVAEHSYHVSFLVPREIQLQALLHDATEAYLGDVGRPLKRHLPEYKRIEELNWLALATKFGLPDKLDPRIHEMDGLICLAEQRQLCTRWDDGHDARQHGIVGKPPDVQIAGYPPETAEALFLQRFDDLTTYK